MRYPTKSNAAASASCRSAHGVKTERSSSGATGVGGGHAGEDHPHAELARGGLGAEQERGGLAEQLRAGDVEDDHLGAVLRDAIEQRREHPGDARGVERAHEGEEEDALVRLEDRRGQLADGAEELLLGVVGRLELLYAALQLGVVLEVAAAGRRQLARQAAQHVGEDAELVAPLHVGQVDVLAVDDLADAAAQGAEQSAILFGPAAAGVVFAAHRRGVFSGAFWGAFWGRASPSSQRTSRTQNGAPLRRQGLWTSRTLVAS